MPCTSRCARPCRPRCTFRTDRRHSHKRPRLSVCGPPRRGNAPGQTPAAALTGVHSDLVITLRPLVDQVGCDDVGSGSSHRSLHSSAASLCSWPAWASTASRRTASAAEDRKLASGSRSAPDLPVLSRSSGSEPSFSSRSDRLGAAVSLWLSRFVSPLLVGLEPNDPFTMVAGIACSERSAASPHGYPRVARRA